MGEIVNLRRARKDVERRARDAKAAENRARYGRPKFERETTRAEARRAEALFEGSRIESPAAPTPTRHRERSEAVQETRSQRE